MSPEEANNLKERVEELERIIGALYSNSTIPFDIGEAIKARVGTLQDVSSKTAASETVSINEAGVATKSAANPPDGFFNTADGKYIPFYN